MVFQPAVASAARSKAMDAPKLINDLLLEVAKPLMLKPAEATQRATLFLSNIDQEAMYKVECVYFFEAATIPNRSDIASVVYQALSKVLVPYNFMAGRFQANVSEQRVEIDCNDAGVLFTSARSRLKLSDLGDVSVPNSAYRSLLLQPEDSLGLFDSPLATFQVTTFVDGGFAFGMTIFHSIMDGTGVTGFLRNLGSLARGEGLLFVPNPNREFLKARDPPRPDYYEEIACKVFRVSKFSDINLLPFNPTLIGINNTAPERHVFKSFPFSSKMLEALKAHAVSDGEVNGCSTFEVMTAHVVKEIARARDLDPQLLVSMFMAVDFSKKLSSGVPTNFCCNAVVTACVAATAEELCSKSLGYFTKKVQEAVKDANEEYVRSWTDFWQVNRIGPARIPCGGCISGWWKLPFYDLDFGWGRPVYAGPVPNQLTGFVVLLSNGKNDGGLNLYLSLGTQEMEMFQRNIYSVFD